MDYIFQLHLQTRKNMLFVVSELSDDRLLFTPPPFKNNLLWNLGHVIIVHQLLCYRSVGLAINISEELVKDLKKDSSPNQWKKHPDINLIKEKLISTSEKFYEDFKRGLFDLDKPFQNKMRMVYGNMLATPREAILFNNIHEAMHLGIIMELSKFV